MGRTYVCSKGHTQMWLGANGIIGATPTCLKDLFWGNIFKSIIFKILQNCLKKSLKFSSYYYVKFYIKYLTIYVIFKSFEVYL